MDKLASYHWLVLHGFHGEIDFGTISSLLLAIYVSWSHQFPHIYLATSTYSTQKISYCVLFIPPPFFLIGYLIRSRTKMTYASSTLKSWKLINSIIMFQYQKYRFFSTNLSQPHSIFQFYLPKENIHHGNRGFENCF